MKVNHKNGKKTSAMSNLQKFSVVDLHTNTTFLSYVVPLFQNESSCKVLQMKMPMMCMIMDL